MRVCAKAAKGKLDRMGLAGHDARLGQESCYDRAGALPVVGKGIIGSGIDRQAWHAIQILDRDGDAHHRPQVHAGFQQPVHCLRLRHRAGSGPAAIGVQTVLGVVMTGGRISHEVGCAHGARAKLGGKFFKRSLGHVRHLSKVGAASS